MDSVINNTQHDSSSDAADVLINSTRAPVQTQHKPNKVNLYIRRLSEDQPTPSQPEGLKENQACGPSNHGSQLLKKDPRREKSKAQTSMQRENSKLKADEDVHISRFCADGREAVSAALKRRCQSVNRNVTVQLLDRELSQTSEGVRDAHCPSVDAGASVSVTAISAAAFAATAPLLKAQSEMEAQITHVTSELKRLQTAESRAAGTASAGRAAHLEEQLNVLIQQRLQHLEMIQCQQIQLQNRLLGSALDAVAARANTDSQTHHTGSDARQTQSLPDHSLSDTDKSSAGHPQPVTKVEDREKRTSGHKNPMDMPAPRKVIPKPTHWTSSAKAIKPQRRNGRIQDQNPNHQRSPERRSVQSVGVKTLAMATADNGLPKRSRDRQTSPAASVLLTEDRDPSEPPKRQNTQENHREQIQSSSSAVQRASEMLRDLGRLKNEMSRLMQTADAFPVQHAKSTQNSRSSYLTPSTTAPPPSTTPVSMPSEPADEIPVSAVPLNRASVLKSNQPPASMFEDAGQILRQVRHSRKILEENLQAVLRAGDGEILHTQLEALSKNRDVSEQLRIKKTVNAWINTLSKEIQDELARESSVSQKRTVESNTAVSQKVQQVLVNGSKREAGLRGRGPSAPEKKTSVRGSARAQTENTQQPNLCVRTKPEKNQEMVQPVLKPQGDEEYLAKLYGKALYEGHRRTLKKGPYLRFNSPLPKSKTQRPKVIETVKGVVMKSSKTQTSPFLDGVSALQSSVSEPRFLFSPSDAQQQLPGSPVRGFLIPMAIPLGKPRLDSQAPVPSRVSISDKTPTVITSFPPVTVPEPKPAPVIRKPNTVLLEVQSEPKKRTPQLEIQVQPGVNIESVLHNRPTSSMPSIPADTFLHPAAAEEPNAHEEENVFPGSSFLEVADISQETHVGVSDSPVELNGLPSPPAVMYHGPAFPPQTPRPTLLTEPVLSTIQQRETLENRLVDWVEQQIMSRMITGMFPQPVQTDPANQSEHEDSVTSDIVETAGGAGLQLFVDAGVPVDSELIRECVNEVLSETVALMLGQRETQRVPTAPAQSQETHAEQKTAVPTPVPTPEPKPKEPPSPVRTPDLSEQFSMSPKENQPQESVSPGPARIPVDTPTATPITSPIRVATPSPPPASQSPEPASLRNHPWGVTELPLKEEEPHSEREEQPQPVVMSVAREEEEESLIPTASPLAPEPETLPPPLQPVRQEPPPPSPAAESDSTSSEESSSSSSDTVTESETAARHISEGEVLLAHGQTAAVRVLGEEGIFLPNVLTSLNSSLHGVQDMDYDPPSEGQVIRGPRLQAHHDPVLSLLARMERGPFSQSQQPERWCEDESSGEISEGQRPHLTAAVERVLTGHSLIDQQRSTEMSPHSTLTSPGQVLNDHTGAVAEDSGLSINLRSPGKPREAEVYHVMNVSSHQSEDAVHQQSFETTHTLHRPAPILVKQYKDQEQPELPKQRRSSNDSFFEDNEKDNGISQQRGGAGSDVRRLPSVRQDRESVSLSSVEGDTDSSANDVF